MGEDTSPPARSSLTGSLEIPVNVSSGIGRNMLLFDVQEVMLDYNKSVNHVPPSREQLSVCHTLKRPPSVQGQACMGCCSGGTGRDWSDQSSPDAADSLGMQWYTSLAVSRRARETRSGLLIHTMVTWSHRQYLQRAVPLYSRRASSFRAEFISAASSSQDKPAAAPCSCSAWVALLLTTMIRFGDRGMMIFQKYRSSLSDQILPVIAPMLLTLLSEEPKVIRWGSVCRRNEQTATHQVFGKCGSNEGEQTEQSLAQL